MKQSTVYSAGNLAKPVCVFWLAARMKTPHHDPLMEKVSKVRRNGFLQATVQNSGTLSELPSVWGIKHSCAVQRL